MTHAQCLYTHTVTVYYTNNVQCKIYDKQIIFLAIARMTLHDIYSFDIIHLEYTLLAFHGSSTWIEYYVTVAFEAVEIQ